MNGLVLAGGPEAARIVTVDVQTARWSRESSAVQVIGVLPTGNGDPEAGEQEAPTGGTPPFTVGVRVTLIGRPSGDVSTGDGHPIVIGLVVAPVVAETSGDERPGTPSLRNACMTK